MSNLRRALVAVLLLALAVFAWLWVTRPRRVEMAGYAPADSVAYFEVENLPEVFDAFTATGAWRELAPAAGVEARRGWRGWLPGFVSFTGLGPSETVVLSRAQVAVTVLGFQAAEESDTTLRYSPRAALVAETHTSGWRVRAAVEKLVGDFARRSMGAPPVERKEVDGVPFYTLAEEAGARRKIVAAVDGSVAFVGNDEAAVRACLDVRRGARPSLATDEGLREMRARLGGDGALAFGYAPRGSVAKTVEFFAPAFVGSITEDPQMQSVLATLAPRVVNQTLGSVGWIARADGGGIEDAYFVSLAGGMAERLQGPLTAAQHTYGAAAVLPPDVHQVSFYDFRSPEEAYRGTGAALSSQVDAASAIFVTRGLMEFLKPYGVENPREFLRACGTQLATARLAPSSEGKVLVASVRDRAALREQALAHLGRGSKAERVGDVELLVSDDPELGAAAFAGEHLLMGSEGDVRRCVGAIGEGRTLREGAALKAAAPEFFESGAFARTFTDDREAARNVLSHLARGGGGDAGALEAALARRGFSVSETRLAEGGFEKRTRSAFGLFGEVYARLAPH
jgi:hypothetical protein